jgi:signal transduction histidine kinase
MRTRRALAVAALALGVALVSGLVVRDAVERVGRPFPGFLLWDNGTLVALHTESWSGARAGLPLNGGRIVSVDGAPFAGGRALFDAVDAAGAGTVHEYVVLESGQARSYRVPAMRMGWGDFAATFGNYLFNSLFFFAIGLVALALRPDLAAARALAAAMLSIGLLMVLAIDFVASWRLVPLCQMVEASVPPAFASLALLFPVERLSPRTRRVAMAVLFAGYLALGAANVWLFRRDPELGRAITSAVYLSIAAIAFAMLASLGHALRRAREVRQRIQAAVVFAGAVVAFLFPSLAVLAFFPLGWSFSFTWITSLLLFFPLSILYAVVRYDLLGAERFIRITLGYTVASAAVLLAYVLLAFVLDRLVAPGTSRGPASSFALLLAIAIAFDPIRRRVQEAVDRVFYRTVLDAGRVLEEAGSELAALVDEAAIIRLAPERLRDALHLEWAELGPPGAERPGTAHREPVSFRGEELGVLLAGPKRSGAPWSAAERELARGLATQLALALRNARSLEALRAAQETLRRRERLAVIGEFAGAVAHGVRNPLAGIRAAAQMAREQLGPGAGAETLQALIHEADRLDQRVRTLLDYSRPFEPRLAPTALEPRIRAAVSALAGSAASRGIEVRVDLAPDLPLAEVDPDYLEEVLLELGGNALRATSPGGTLVFSAAREGARVALRVRDSGSGVPEGVRGRLFEPFFTTRPDGTGMGLATVRKIVEQMGGEIDLETSGEAGSTFAVRLPAAARRR